MIAETPDVLLITTAADAASDSVARSLDVAGTNYFRINTEDFPADCKSAVWLGSQTPRILWDSQRQVDLSCLHAVWLRRHRLPVLQDMHPAHEEYCLRESEWYVRGILFAIASRDEHTKWMSSPAALWQAESKIRQLQAAAEAGLECPVTLVSNDPVAIRGFGRSHGPLIAKPLKLGYFDYGERQAATFTTAIGRDSLEDDAALLAAPVIYQPNIKKKFDVRVTIVDKTVFAATIDSQSEMSAVTDWRQTATDLRHDRHTLPSTLENACLALMQKLQLNYGALDFVLTPEGRYVFLEINPNGQWLWIEEKLEFPITESISTWLQSQARKS